MNKQFDGYNDLHNTYSAKRHKPSKPELDRLADRPHYKALYENQLSVNKGLLWGLGITVALSTLLFTGMYSHNKADSNRLQRLYDNALQFSNEASIYLDDYSEKLSQRDGQLAQCLNVLQSRKQTGKVSFYTDNGCLGCNEGRIMANGKKFDENKLTLAHNKIPLGTLVLVKNLDNGLFTEAEVTDRGGFGKYNRIADLSKATCEAINCKTDKSIIEISY